MSSKSPNHPFVIWSACILWLTSIFAIVWSLLLFFCLGDILLLTCTDLVTAVVLLSGIIMLPTNLSIVKTIANGKKIDSKVKVIFCRLRACIVWIIIINVIGVILCIQRIFSCREITMRYISNSMRQYRTVPKYKHFIDNIQWFLGCCGLYSYKDWFEFDWHDKVRDYDWTAISVRDAKSTMQTETDSVPLSCCKSGSCVSNYLKELGTYSINTNGCGNFMYHIILVFLGIHLFMFFLVIILEVLLLKYITKTSKTSKSRKSSKKFNIKNIMSVNDHFEVSSGSSLLNADDSNEELCARKCYVDDNDENF